MAWSKFAEALRIASYVPRDRVTERKLLIMGNARRRGLLALLLAGVLTAGTSWGAAGAAVPAELTTAGPTVGDDPSDAPPSTRGAQRRSSRMTTSAAGETRLLQDPDGSTVYRVEDGHDLDQYLCRDASPLDWSMDLNADFGPVDADGHPVAGNKLFGKTVKLTMNVYDVDEASGEVDHLYVNGTKVGGNLTGANDQWATNTVEVPSELLELPHPGNPTGTNELSVDIDTTNDGWCVEIGWAELRPGSAPVLPVIFAHGIDAGSGSMADMQGYFENRFPALKGRTRRPQMTESGTIGANARHLYDSAIDLLEDEPVKKVDVVALSKGGLDARKFASDHPGMVRNLIMIGTPNGGTPLADLMCGAQAANRLVRLYFSLRGRSCFDPTKGYAQMQVSYVRGIFNTFTRDSRATQYKTIAGRNGKPYLLGDNDGVVQVGSVRALDRVLRNGGTHVNLTSTLNSKHEDLVRPGGNAYPIAAEGLYPSGSMLSQRASGSRTSARAASGPLGQGEGPSDTVDAGKTESYPLDVVNGQAAELLVFGDPGLTFSISGVTGEAANLFGLPATRFSFTGPKTLQVSNPTTADADFGSLLTVESSRTLDLQVPTVATSQSSVPITATLTQARTDDVLTFTVTDESGESVDDGTMTPSSAGQWTADLLGLSSGSYTVSVSTEGAEKRFASAPLQVASGLGIDDAFGETLIDDDDDSRADRLRVTVPVDTAGPGQFSISARLVSPDGEVATASSPLTFLAGGLDEFDLDFDGRTLGNSSAAAPWELVDVVLTDADSNVVEYKESLGEITNSDPSYYEYDAIVMGQFSDSTRDEDGDGALDFLDITFDADVAFDDSYAVNGKLVAEDGTEIARAQDVLSFDEGSNTGRLSFSAADIKAAGKSGRFILRDFQIYPQSDQSSSVSLVDAHTTKSYNAEDLTESTGGGGGGALEPTGSVVVSGIPEVGETLTVTSEPTWSAPSTVTTQWLRDGQPITGATSSSYTLTPDDEGHEISALLTATAQGYDDGYAESDAVSVGQGLLERTGEVTIAGTPRVGRQLTAGELPTWTPSADLSFQWLRNTSPITGATSRTYTVVPADHEQELVLQVTAEADGFADDVAESDPVSIGLGQLQRTGVLTMSGTPTVGQTLSVDRTPTYTPSASVAYVWLRDGRPIEGATGTSYAVTSADVGSAVAVRQIASREKYEDYVVDSDPQVVAARVIEGEGVPTVSGTPALGSTLTATAPSWSVDGATVDYAFAWFRDGVAIPGATGESYTVTVDDLGSDLTAQVTGSADGAPDRVATSEASTVSKVKPVMTVNATPGKGRVSLASTLSAAGVPKRLMTGDLVVKRGRTEVGSGEVRRGRSTILLTGQRAGTRTYKVVFVATDTLKRARQVVTTRVR